MSNIDPVVVGEAVWRLGRAPRFLAKASLFSVPAVGGLLRVLGQIPVERGGASRGAIPLSAAKRLLAEGQGVIVYPEGSLTRDPDLWPMRGKTGAARLALQLGLPVIPMAHWGAQTLMPVNTTRIRLRPRARVQVIFGDPVDLSDLGRVADKSGDADRDRPDHGRDHRAARGAARRDRPARALGPGEARPDRDRLLLMPTPRFHRSGVLADPGLQDEGTRP